MAPSRKSNFAASRLLKAGLRTKSSDATSLSAQKREQATPHLASAKTSDAPPPSKKKKSNFDKPSSQSNVEALTRRARLVRSKESAGRELLSLHVPSVSGGDTEIDLSFLLDFPRLVDPVADALYSMANESELATSTLVSYVSGLKGAGRFFGYLKESNRPGFALSDLTTSEVNAFVNWLNDSDTKVDSTRHSAYYQARRLFRCIQEKPRWKAQMDPRLQFPPDPWPDVQRRDLKVAEVVPLKELSELYRACLSEVVQTMAQVRQLRAELSAAVEA